MGPLSFQVLVICIFFFFFGSLEKLLIAFCIAYGSVYSLWNFLLEAATNGALIS